MPSVVPTSVEEATILSGIPLEVLKIDKLRRIAQFNRILNSPIFSLVPV